MKYGVIVFKNTENIGDDIQSYAASRLLPKVDYYVEREYIDTFVPNKKEFVKVLMNGWFMHYKHNFLPSPYIDPLFVSTHFSSYDTYGIKNEYIKSNADYLKKYAPIGCRDIHSKNVLDSFGIDNYVSGCVTLTLDKFEIKKSDEDYICCVDLSDDVLKHVNENSKIKVIEKSHILNQNDNKKLSYEERFKKVEELLKLYQNAKLVITSRLHCALPCIALGTPVILVKDDKSIYYKDRIESFLEYLNYYSESDFLKEDFANLFKLKNKNHYIEVKKNIINRINDEIKVTDKDISELPEIKDFNDIYVKRKNKIDKLLDIVLNKQLELYNDNLNNKASSEYWEKQYNDLIETNKRVLEENDTYWKKQFDDLLKDKELAVKQNDDYWKKEFSSLLEKYNNLLNKGVLKWKRK